MNRMRSLLQTLSARTAGILVVASLLTGSIVVGIEKWIHEPRERQATKQSHLLMTQEVARLLERSPNRSSYNETLTALLAGIDSIQRARVVTRDGIILHSAHRGELGTRVNPPRGVALQNSTLLREDGDGLLVVRESIQMPGSTQSAPALLELRVSGESLDEGYGTERLMLMAIIMLQIGVFFLVWLLFRRFLVRPTNLLLGSMKRVASGDLTERVELESPYEFAELGRTFNKMVSKLERANQQLSSYYNEVMARAERLATIGELTTAMSHEIKNPLAGLAGALHVLRVDPALQSQREVLDEMARTVDRLNRTTGELLSYGRAPEPNPAPHDINRCVQAVLFFLRRQTDAAVGVEIEAHLAPDLPPVQVDPQQLQQIALNVGLNALQAMGARGSLTVQTAHAPSQGQVLVTLSDTGPGIPSAVMERVFDPFFTTKTGGTGLGLTISKRLIEDLGGSIRIDQPPHGGTSVEIAVPVAETGSELHS